MNRVMNPFFQSPNGLLHSVWDISPDEMKRGTIVEEPTWYCCDIVKSQMGKDKDGQPLWKLEAKILNAGKYEGVPVQFQFSSKAKGMSVRFIEVLKGEATDRTSHVRVDTDHATGKRVELFIANRTFEGKVFNDVKDYRACPHEMGVPDHNSNGENAE